MTSPPPRDRIASLHLFGVEGLGIASAIGHMATDRRRLRQMPGVVFSKLLGTGDGRTFTPRDADPRLWGMFLVWSSREHLLEFEASSRVFRGWNDRSMESCSVELQPLRWKGSWSGQQPFGPDDRRDSTPWTGPVAALTRARIRPTQWRTFWQSVPPVAADAQRTEGLRFSLGIGEAPIGLQATFSVWESADDIDRFAYRQNPHRDVIRRTHSTGWYAEEMFIRFGVVRVRGTVKGQSV